MCPETYSVFASWIPKCPPLALPPSLQLPGWCPPPFLPSPSLPQRPPGPVPTVRRTLPQGFYTWGALPVSSGDFSLLLSPTPSPLGGVCVVLLVLLVNPVSILERVLGDWDFCGHHSLGYREDPSVAFMRLCS